jgi:O-methyltransferase involved in polyketide biosynthesis
MEKFKLADLPPVARTLFIPLACRAGEAPRPDAILRDPRAAQLFAQFEDGLTSLKGLDGHDRVAVLMRARQFDTFAGTFLGRHPDALVVDIGCGLDTRFDRLDNGQMAWLGLDLPEVIGLRRRFLPDGERNRTLSGSILDPSWLDEVAREDRPVIFLAEGVFSYFPEEDVKKVICGLAERFPAGELVFDTTSSFSVRMHNRTSGVLKATQTRLNWAVDDPRSLEAWGLTLLDAWGYFDRHEPRLGIGNLFRYIPALAGANRVVHYRLIRLP